MSRRDEEDEGVVFDDATCVHATPQAIRVRFTRSASGRPVTYEGWVPKACVHDDSEVFDAGDNASGRLVIKTWWAEREGWA